MAGDDGQNPVMNVIGNYVCDRARVEVQPKGEDMADITVSWSNSAFDHAEWTMSGVFDTDTMTVSYSDCVMKNVAYDRDSEETDKIPLETIIYTDGSGKIIFGEDGTLTWEDDQDHAAEGMVFEYLLVFPPEEPLSAMMTGNAKYIMYVGTNDKDTYEPVLPLDEARELANNICAKYVESGFTQIDARGGWLDDNGVLAQEDTLIYIFVDVTEDQLQKISDELLDKLHQSSILIEKQNALYTFYSAD